MNTRLLWVVLALVAVFSVNKSLDSDQAWSPILWPAMQASNPPTLPFYQEQLIPNAGQNSTHSASVSLLPSGDLISFWFAGTREGHKDVRIFKSVFHQDTSKWDKPIPVLGSTGVGKDLGRYIGKLGNPLVFVDSKQRMWLFFVSVSYGGWAGSSLNVMWSDDVGTTWTTPKKLVTSPFINVSTLVRNHMFELEDGSLLLPVYHEFIAQFPETLRVSRDGEVIVKQRMYGSGGGIQPVFFEGNKGEVHAYMRSGSHTKDWRVLSLTSLDEGESWQDFQMTELPNPNAAQVATKVADKLWIWVGNYHQQYRQDMTLAVSSDLNKPWQKLVSFEQGKEGDRFSYPTLIEDKQGIWHLLYTNNRTHIKHIQFNVAWLNQQMQGMPF